MRHITGYFKGFFYYFKGIGFFIVHPALWKYVVLPWIVLAFLFSSVLGPYFILYPQYLEEFKKFVIDPPTTAIVLKLILAAMLLPVFSLLLLIPVFGSDLFEYTMVFLFGSEIKVFVNVILGFFAMLVFLLTQSVINKFFYKKLSRKVEETVLGKVVAASSKGFFKEMWEGIKDMWHALRVYVCVVLVILVCSFIPVVREVVSALSVSYYTGVAYLDYLFKRRNLHYKSKREKIRQNLGMVIGFGSICFLLLFFPVVNIFFIPLNVAVGTLLAVELTKTKTIQKA